MNRKISIVTTFSDSGYEEYGKGFLESCDKFLDPVINVIVYKDNVHVAPSDRRFVFNLEQSVPDLTKFKLRNSFRDETGAKLKRQSVRFSHKVYALYNAAMTTESRYLIWLDGDTEFFDHVDPEFFYKFLPEGYMVGYLGRPGEAFSECGFMIYDLFHPQTKAFFERFKWYYDTDELYKLKEWHDSYIFDVVRKEFEKNQNILTKNLSENVNKHQFNTVLNGYIMHLKGNRKQERDRMFEKAMRRKSELSKSLNQ